MAKQPRIVMLGDCQSFFASVEKAAHPEYKHRPLVVAGDPERRSGIVLAACPLAKQYGITTAERLGSALGKCPQLVVVRPRMQTYIDVSQQITSIMMSYTDQVEPYSIDEQFLDLTGSIQLFGRSPQALARLIQDHILQATGVFVRFGIASNKTLAKMACDNFAKKNREGIFTLSDEQVAQVMWPLPIRSLFMVGSRMSAHFTSLGLDTIGKLAQTPLPRLKQLLRRKFNKNSDLTAEQYWHLANGIDDSPVSMSTHRVPPKSIGHVMTLPYDYSRIEDIRIILLELAELVCQRCRKQGFMAQVVTAGAAGADFSKPTSFQRQMKLLDPTNLAKQVYQAACQLFDQHWDGLPVRRVGITISMLTSDSEYQLSLLDPDYEKAASLAHTIDALKDKYGNAIILPAVSYTHAGQAIHRSQKIGGHMK